MNDVRGAGRIAGLCMRCLAVLTLMNLPVVLAGWLVDDESFLGFTFSIYPFVVATAVVPVLLIGFPAGLLVSHLLRAELDERRHVVAFAITGAILSVTICVVAGMVHGSTAWVVVLVAAAEGAIGAGGARWWSGRPRRVRRTPTDEQVEDEAVSRALDA